MGAQASWMDPDAQTQDLLYVSHYTDGSVFAYSYPGGNLEGRFTKVQAGGLCSDKDGDIFIPQQGEILEYAHGGTRATAVFRNALRTVFHFCAVDPTSGALALSGSDDPKFGVAIYADAKTSPKIYGGGHRSGDSWSCTYDNAGNLFVESGDANLLELPKGGKQLIEIAWSGGRPAHVGSIQWDGKHLAVESAAHDSASTTLFRYSVSASRATLVNETVLKGGGGSPQFWIHGGKIVVPRTSGVTLYDYPGGGGPTDVIKNERESLAVTVSPATVHKFAVTTYHYNNMRTGWNKNESTLTYNSVGSGFGLLHTVTLDDQVDAQPLIVPNENTTRGASPGKHDVVYVVTENDTIYAIDASSGAILFDQNLGTPVPQPLGCNNNGPNVGINGTPVIDRAANQMYVIDYTLQNGVPTHRIHELNLADLTDSVTPVVVSASHQLTDGSTYTFNATYQRQRTGLLEASGNIYAGFGSFCDYDASKSRGWLLGWQAGSLTPLAANQLNDVLATSPKNFFLSSVWMSGYGVAADHAGNVYFATGNSDPSGMSYNSATNLSESVVKMSSDLTSVLSFFTPSNVDELDVKDRDFGSGGVLLLPMNGSIVPLAAAAGKYGTLYLLDRNNLGGYNPSGPNDDLAEEPIGGCWCGQSYFDAASDSVPRIVASGGNNVSVWKIQTSPSITLTPAGTSPNLPGGQDPGFFTTVSSAGSNAGAIIWAVARPQSVPGNVTLFAFKSQPSSGATLQTLFQAAAGTWQDPHGNSDLVPVVANGKVYVASYKQLEIFGIGGKAAKAAPIAAPVFAAPAGAPHQVTGKLLTISGSLLTLQTRAGKIVGVDDSVAVRRERSSVLIAGEPFTAWGMYDPPGVLHATLILRAKPSKSTWPLDR